MLAGSICPPTTPWQLDHYKRLYHQLHNLESHPHVLPEARETLLSLFAEALAKVRRNVSGTILDIEIFDEKALRAFIRGKEQRITAKLEGYLQHRRNGGKRQLFETFEQARDWLIRKAPSKLVDGAWLGHVHKMSTPFEHRRVTKNAWQVMSEELGDGDVSKHHAAIYLQLLQSIGVTLPEADSLDFIGADFGQEDVDDWKAAVAQLLISLFPNEFTAEILGFNLHFECLARDTMLASRELKELKIDNAYFLLHLSIDNSDSGHTAMATQIVIDYIRQIRAMHGDTAADQAWRGVQVGYLLSDMFGGHVPTNLAHDVAPLNVFNESAADLIKIFASKSNASASLHCTSRVMIGGQRLSEWLQAFASAEDHSACQTEFLIQLARCRPWIYAGDITRSKLVQALEWKGKMFGAFTESEMGILKNWIDNLRAPVSGPSSEYWSFVKKSDRSYEEVLSKASILDGWPIMAERGTAKPWESYSPTLSIGHSRLPRENIDAGELLALWFAHPCLLESFVSIPIRTCTRGTAAVIRILRAQRGFLDEGEGVAGMDEFRRTDYASLVSIGFEMARSSGIRAPQNLREAISIASKGTTADFAVSMVEWSSRPLEHRSALLGMAWAFVGLHEALSDHDYSILSEKFRIRLGRMSQKEREAFAHCRKELLVDEKQCRDFEAAARMTEEVIADCFF
ncbi:hypothetical protein F5Y16DRAFT_416840 [Xylariaceae sp. FL0255]|nr:hypothetical protein F5Y16DRAFT_416840 [Xylariaceae sp. FL0255]